MAKRMAEQMELFEPVERGFDEGGLMEEGGMVDEESGNEVPPGSLREEVRDDIPAQLSEGEFVFPADVVRYIGLEKLMMMRQEAKQGLAQMEAMGQMGNGDEAVMEDDLPFDMYDLDVDDEEEYNSETRNFQVGGFVSPFGQQPYQQPTQVNPQTGTYTLPGTGIAGYQMPSGGQTGYTPYGGATPYFQPVQFTGPQFQTSLQTTNLPTFGETVGTRPGQYDELRTYVNDAGQILQIPFKDGQPIYPIPEGYKLQGEQPKAEQPVTMPVTGTATTRDTGGGDGGVGVTSPSVTGTVTGLTSTASTLSETGGFLTSDIASNANAYGGNAKFGLSNPAMRDAVKMQAAYQAATFGILGPITSMGKTFGLMDASMNDMAIAGQTGKVAALTSLGMARPGQITTDQQATYYGNMITAAHKAKEQGLDVRDALAAEMSKAEYAEALNSAANSAMQALGYGTNAMADPASVSRAIAGYNALASEYEDAANATATGKGVVRDSKGNPVTSIDPVTGQKTNVMTAQARAQLNAELEAAKTARARAEAIAAAAARAKGNEERGESTTNTAMARALADKATKDAEDAGLDYGDEFGNMPDSDFGGPTGAGIGPGETSRSGSSPADSARDGGNPGGSSSSGGGGGQGESSDGSAGGAGSGTGGGASSGCFEKGTLFKMADGTTKCVEDIKPGDKMYKGGLVYAVMQGDGLLEDWYDYNGIHVTSGHPVLDNGVWKRVGETSSKKAIDKREVYYSLMNTNHLMIAENGTEFTDFVEISADIGGRGEWMMEMLNQRQAA